MTREDDPTLPDKVATWPYLVRIEMVGAMVVTLGLVAWSVVVDAPLEAPADESLTPNPAKAPWYFVGLQELLVYFDPWIAGVMVPGLIILGLAAIPYLDPNPRGVGYFCFRERRAAIAIFLAGFLGLWIAPILVGVFFRGPGWSWFWPWEPWEGEGIAEAVALRDLADLVGIPAGWPAGIAGAAVVLAWYGLPFAWAWKRRAALGLDGVRVAVLVFLGASMAGIPAKMLLRWALDVQYVWVTPWFNV